MLYGKCPECENIYSEVLWHEELADKKGVSLSRIKMPLRDTTSGAILYCPGCGAEVARSEVKITTTTDNTLECLLKQVYYFTLKRLKELREIGVIFDVTSDMSFISKYRETGVPFVALHICPDIKPNPFTSGAINKLQGTFAKLYVIKDTETPLARIRPVSLTVTFEVASKDLYMQWVHPDGVKISDIINHINGIKRNLHHKVRPKNSSTPKVIKGADGNVYVTYPILNGELFTTMRMDEFKLNPAVNAPELTFEELLNVLISS